MYIKYTLSYFNELYTRKTINHNNTRLKTIYLIQLIDMFLIRYVIFNKDKITINATILKTIYGNNYKAHLQYLLDNNFIYLYKNYSTSRHGKIYKLTNEAKQSNIITTSVNVPKRLQQKLEKFATQTNLDNHIKQKIIDDLYKIDIDYDTAKYWIDNNITETKPYLVNSTNILKIKNKDIHYSFDSYGRFHTNFTNLKKHIRENYLTINKNKLKEIDITNSQPLFLYVLMKNEGFTKFNGFDHDVLTGIIYNEIQKEYKIDSRKEVKVNIYSVLFGRNLTKKKWDSIFNNKYPDVYKWIVQYKHKHKNYKIIAQTLQTIESDFIFKKFIPEIYAYNKNIPLITIHDSIMLPEIYYDNVYKIFQNSLHHIVN